MHIRKSISNIKGRIIKHVLNHKSHINSILTYLYVTSSGNRVSNARKYIKSNYKRIDDCFMEEYDLLVDMIRWDVNSGVKHDEYLLFQFYSLTEEEKSEYVSNYERRQYFTQNTTKETSRIYNDKYLTYNTYKKYYKRDVAKISSSSGHELLDSFLSLHDKCVLKPYNSSKGIGIKILHRDSLNKTDLSGLLSSYQEYLIEQYIQQHEAMSRLHPDSVNTVRLVLLKNFNNKRCQFLYALLRVGIGGAEIDNLSAGGIGAAIDLELGVVCTNAFDYHGVSFEVHPDSKVKFIGFKVPEWESLKSIAVELSNIIPDEKRIIGWDFAYSTSGWVIVEGNSLPSFSGYQNCTQRGLRLRLHELGVNL